jgi:alginate O-acetyltransferase complex protein AlgI
MISVFMVLEWMGREDNFALEKTAMRQPPVVNFLLYYAIIIALILFGGDKNQFIYFQF